METPFATGVEQRMSLPLFLDGRKLLQRLIWVSVSCMIQLDALFISIDKIEAAMTLENEE